MDPRLPEDRTSGSVGVGDYPYTAERKHTETGGESRQGPLGRPILFVLIGGLALAAVYLIGTQIWSNSEDLPPPGQIEDGAPPEAAVLPAPVPAATP